MSLFKRFSIKGLFNALLILSIIILLGMTVGIQQAISPVKNDWTQYLDNVAKRQQLLMDIKSEFGYGGVIHNFKNYVLRGQDKYYQRLDAGFTQLDKLLAEYGSLTSISHTEKEALKSISAVASEYHKHLDNVRSMAQAGQTPKQIDGTVKVSDSPAFDAFAVLDKSYQDLTDNTSHTISQHISSASTLSLWLSGLTILIISIGIFLLSRSVVNGIRDVQTTLSHVEQNNDLVIRLPAEGNNEIAVFSRSVNSLLEHFSKMISQVINASVEVGMSSADQIRIVESMVTGVRNQHLEIDQVATAMNEMSATVLEVAENATHVAKAAQQANDETQNGGHVMDNTISTMEKLRSRIESTAQVIEKLDDESTEISKVLGVITGISEQTNLLALNAAIEAARAGEQGRGFAVVADEVRALAGRTKTSADEIREMIERLQNEVRNTVSEMEESQENAQASSEQAAAAGQAFERIATEIGSINEMVMQIATATEEQSHVAEEMNKNISNISTEASSTAQSGNDTLDATATIGTMVEELRSQASIFKVDDLHLHLSQAKSAHLAWRGRLRAYLDGKGGLSAEQASDHHDCSLGKWYYNQGMAEFGHIPEMTELEKPHAELHSIIKNIIHLQESGQKARAEEEYVKVDPLSQRIVGLLEVIQSKV
ncbi:MAG: CZB domain-containing protein [Candidatus Thiodiazotropha sp. (ex Semelilucina semeliformis)]|nr:CZB domain-containing protein [Candidatus Thiodiazotropha sp. (ex Semelilucina semeliformis)]